MKENKKEISESVQAEPVEIDAVNNKSQDETIKQQPKKKKNLFLQRLVITLIIVIVFAGAICVPYLTGDKAIPTDEVTEEEKKVLEEAPKTIRDITKEYLIIDGYTNEQADSMISELLDGNVVYGEKDSIYSNQIVKGLEISTNFTINIDGYQATGYWFKNSSYAYNYIGIALDNFTVTKEQKKDNIYAIVANCNVSDMQEYIVQKGSFVLVMTSMGISKRDEYRPKMEEFVEKMTGFRWEGDLFN